MMRRICGAAFLLSVSLGPTAWGAVPPRQPGRFDPLVVHDPVATTPTLAEAVETLALDHPLRQAWEAFRARLGGTWSVYLDRRSGAPLLVEGSGTPWIPGSGNSLSASGDVTLAALEDSLRGFVADNEAILAAGPEELVLDERASGRPTPDVWQVTFDRVTGGLPVEGARLVFTIGHGNLVSFGASRWGGAVVDTEPDVDAREARGLLRAYMGLRADEDAATVTGPDLLVVPMPAEPGKGSSFAGALGQGYRAALAWRVGLRVPRERGTWIGLVDAHSGSILSFQDDDRYGQVKGGVCPESGDGICPEGCEQPGYPMPYAFVSLGCDDEPSNSMGIYDCSVPGATATTALGGPYVLAVDYCGSISASALCGEDIDLGVSAGSDCSVPPFSSDGDTRATRSSFYHANRAAEHARAWLPSVPWLSAQLNDFVNMPSTCNAYWNGSLNFYRSGGGCNNAGEIAGVVVHEWGHGLDQNDGGGFDVPSEAYADVTAFLYNHRSCVGRGFFQGENCQGYGDPCLDCTGIRDQDWDRHAGHSPATAAGFVAERCGPGSGPCGKEEHCESYLAAETVWDLAARDLPATGLDPDTAWQVTDRLWYASRLGSGGNAYNCAIPASDGCGAATWFNKLRAVDDDDGDLSNGTPHAAAIFAAFDRHGIACGAEGDESNQSRSACPDLAAPDLVARPGSGSVSLSWTPVPDAAAYLVLRNDMGCSFSFTVVGTVDAPATVFTDAGLANGFTESYRVQAVGANPSCVGRLSDCAAVAPQCYAGSIDLDRPTYACDVAIRISVTDANVGAPETTAAIGSTSEPVPETVVLTETPPGSARYVGTIVATRERPAADGRLSLADGDAIVARYVDADDGEGRHEVPVEATATADCVRPLILDVAASGITDSAATVSWSTDQPSESAIIWGAGVPPSTTLACPSLWTSHSIPLADLEPCTTYYYAIRATDVSGNVNVDDNRGSYRHFETLERLPDGGTRPCHSGRIEVDRPSYACSDNVTVTLTDVDLNADPGTAETIFLAPSTDPEAPDVVLVRASSGTEMDPEPLTLTETGPDTSVFTGTIGLDPSAPAPDGTLQVRHGDVVTVSYRDLDDGSGSAVVGHADAVVDCEGPRISDLVVTQQPPFRAVVSWSTSEPATGRVDYGPTPDLAFSATDPVLSTSHSIVLSPVDPCVLLHFVARSTDALGNSSAVDGGGLVHTFETARVPGAVFIDGFELPGGWTLDGEWQVGAPGGRGATDGYGYPDPATAFDGTNVLGTDLTGLGAYPGDFEPGVDITATSPVIDASGLVHGRLAIRRWLNTGGSDYGDFATIDGYRDGWSTIWANHRYRPAKEHAWSLQGYDVSALADGNPQFRIRFTMRTDPVREWSGWNLDDVVLKDGSRPDAEGCGECDTAPSFAGLASAADDDACALTGIRLTWPPAAAWGSGNRGTYAAYRGPSPDFVPSASNLLAAGLEMPPFIDLEPPAGVPLYYLVRAENDESCSTGPNNGGVTDDNTVFLPARDDAARPGAAGSVAGLRLAKINDASIRIAWDPDGAAASYRVYRSDNPRAERAVLLGSTSGTEFDDTGVPPGAGDHYYLVRGVDVCGNEGP